jgi:hypothetical protein
MPQGTNIEFFDVPFDDLGKLKIPLNECCFRSAPAYGLKAIHARACKNIVKTNALEADTQNTKQGFTYPLGRGPHQWVYFKFNFPAPEYSSYNPNFSTHKIPAYSQKIWFDDPWLNLAGLF